jgi:hypothetical protein
MEPVAASRMTDLIPLLTGAALCITFLVVYGGSAAWVVGDAQKRGYSGGVLFLLLWLCGPLSVLIWLFVRPSTRLVDRPVLDYTNADDAIEAASKLDVLGDWDEAIVLYQYAATRWPEHEGYVRKCINVINDKRDGN